jgi:probable HAF family extracellular repeat protein
VPGATNTTAEGINTSGQIVGVYNDSRGEVHSFLYAAGAFTPFDMPGAVATEAYGINTSGQIVGLYADSSRGQHGFLATPLVDKIPPVITVSASPATLSPPNGRLVPVTVLGTITDESGGSGVQEGSAVYQVIDEYGQIQPSGSVTLLDGKYSFTVALQASRRGNDQDGRHYTIVVSARDMAGNLGRAMATVTVPRN